MWGQKAFAPGADPVEESAAFLRRCHSWVGEGGSDAYHRAVSRCLIAPYDDSPASRQELAAFLARGLSPGLDEGIWLRRFQHWWNENPFAGWRPERGWMVRDADEGRLQGFLGLIPAGYAVEGQPTAALLPTSWVTDGSNREGAMLLGRRLQRVGDEVLLVSTTGRLDFQEHMVRTGWQLGQPGHRSFIPFGRWGKRWLNAGASALAAGRRVTAAVDEVRHLRRACQSGRGIEKWVTPESLRWYAASPAREHRFFGVVDGEGELTSYVMLARTPVLGLLDGWSMEDWFTTEESGEELRVLLAEVVGQPREFGLCADGWMGPWLLRLTTVNGDASLSSVTGWLRAPVRLNHLHRVPAALAGLPKRWVLAEGDLGL